MSAGEAVRGTICAMVVAGMLFGLGMLVEKSAITSDCNNYGKTRLYLTWYECKKIEEKR